jgi:ferritin-like metal-binding protein YciE
VRTGFPDFSLRSSAVKRHYEATLEEEKATDQTLTSIAGSVVNQEARAA